MLNAMSHDFLVYTLSKKCSVYCWLANGKTRHEPPDRKPQRGLAGMAGLRADAPSEARGAGGERAGRPRGGWRSGGAAVGAGKLLEERAAQIRKTGDPKATGYLCVMGDLNPQPAD